MRTKIIIGILFLVIIGSIYTASLLPFFTNSAIYRDYIVGYMPLVQKILSVLSILVTAYVASISLNLILTRSFASVIRSNTLAKKVFPLIHWAISIAVWIMAVFFILGAIGVNLGALITGAGIGGVLFALASKEFISNLFGSLSLIFSKNFKIGDTIKVKTFEGTVEEISLSYTRLVDRKGTVIFMPNKLIVSETVENLSMAPMKRADFTCEIPVHDAKKLQKILETTEKEVKKLGGEDMVITSSIDGLTEKGYTMTLKIEATTGDMSVLKKDVWMLLGGKVRGEK
ncbi:MAG: mechanosensitive ion channel [Candidatus Gracilibacteria bacterium]|nr:mechanosensitive ion channel [Candidatus Gracilibacteria bacterium]